MTCSSCSEKKPVEEFYLKRRGRQCKDCIQAKNRAWYQSNKGKRRAASARWQKENRERWLELRARHNRKPETRLKDTIGRLVRNYGLDYDAAIGWLYIKPDGCGLCGASDKRIELDHDHENGLVRGWLCHSCNIGLGAFRDRPEVLDRAAHYLRFHAERVAS